MRHSFLCTMKASLRSLMLAVAMILPLTMMAVGTKPSAGSGSASSPYKIASADNIAWFCNEVNSGKTDICGYLANDIFYDDIDETIPPIGNSSNKYSGTFDGRGCIIRLYKFPNNSDNVGLFGWIKDATIKNIVLSGQLSASGNNVGVAVGHAEGASQIINVHVKNIARLSVGNRSHLGGIVGFITGTTVVKQCSFAGVLNASSSSDCIGGIVGYAEKNAQVTISDCLFSGTITTTHNKPYMGGILGYMDDDGDHLVGITNCLSCGTITSGTTRSLVAAIVGYPRGNVYKKVKNCYAYDPTGETTQLLGNSYDDKDDESNVFKTLDDCKSGAVTYLLNGGPAGTIWRQNLEETKDDFPTLDQSHSRVYFIQPYMCNATPVGSRIYSNNTSKHTHFNVTVKADQTSVGTGSVTQEITTENHHCYLTLTATADKHYKFEKWKIGNYIKQANPWTSEITGETTISYVFGYQLYAIDAKVNDSNMGSVSGAGNYLYNSETDLIATPKAGYLFDYWSDGTTKYSGTTITENRNKLSQKVTGPATYTAYFKAKPSYAVTTKVNSSTMGTATGGGTYVEGTSVTLTATPKTGYEFNYWSDGTTKYNGTTASNGVNTLEITVSKKVTYTAYFKAKKYTITLGETTNGTVSQTNANGVYDYNTKAVLTATPNAGYDFEKWQDGNKDNPRTITVTKDDTYTATFTKHINYYDITVSANNADYGTVTGGGNYAEGTQVTLTATPKEYCRFVNWSDGTNTYSGSTQSDKSNKLEITVTSAKTYTAIFEAIPKYTINANVNNSEMGTVAGGGEFYEGENVTLTATPKTGCHFKNWLVDNVEVAGVSQSDGSNKLTLTVSKSVSCIAVFEKDNKAYAVLSSDNVLTFYYDNVDRSATGTVYSLNVGSNEPGWNSKNADLTKVVFDASFADARPTSCSCWFYNCSQLTTIEGINYLNTSNVTNMDGMFDNCSNLTALDVSKFNTQKVTDMYRMFEGCSNLTALDVSKFNTENVTNMYGMFCNCSKLTALDVSNFNTGNVTSMFSMFDYCSNLTALDVSNFNTEKVTNMGSMFEGCSNLTALDVSNFNTQKVTNMDYMFSGCSNLTALDVSNFNTEKVTNMEGMFRYCSNLTALTIGNFDMQKATIESDMFYACHNLNTLNITYVSPNLKAGTFDTFFNTTGKTVRYVLNDNSIVTTSAGSNIPTITAAASYTRVPENRWGTLIVPFDIKITGDEEFELYEVTGTRTIVNKGKNYPTLITRLYGAGETIPANMPVFIHYSGSFENDIHVNACNLSITTPDIISAIGNGDLNGKILIHGTYGEDLTDENGVTYRAPYLLTENKYTLFGETACITDDSNTSYALPFRAFFNSNLENFVWGFNISNISFPTEDTVQVLTDIVLGKRKKFVVFETDYNNDGKVSIGDVTALVNSLNTPSFSNIFSFSEKNFIYNGRNYFGVIAQ